MILLDNNSHYKTKIRRTVARDLYLAIGAAFSLVSPSVKARSSLLPAPHQCSSAARLPVVVTPSQHPDSVLFLCNVQALIAYPEHSLSRGYLMSAMFAIPRNDTSFGPAVSAKNLVRTRNEWLIRGRR